MLSLIIYIGGPGLSGVNFLLGLSDMLRQYVGDDFDILGFDPRGKANSKSLRVL